jgi:hypothetical protein
MRFLAAVAALLFAIQAHAADLNTSMWSQLDNSNNQTPPNGWPEGMNPAQVNDTARAGMGATKRWYDRMNATLTSGGTANALTLTYAVAPALLVKGDTFQFIAGNTNTGPATLNINSLGAKAITNGGQPLIGGEIITGWVVGVIYDGTNFEVKTSSKMARGMANYVPDNSPFQQYNPNLANASIALTMGSTASPDTSLNSPVVMQKIGSVHGDYRLGSTALISLITGGAAHDAHGFALTVQTNDVIGWDGTGNHTFNQAVQGTCNLLAPGIHGWCEGVIGEVNTWGVWDFMMGFEGAINNQSGTDSPQAFDPTHFDASFLASCGAHGAIAGSAKCGTAFLVNPNQTLPNIFRRGFYVPAGTTVTESSFESAATTAPYGLDLGHGAFSGAAVRVPNGNGLFGLNAAGSGNIAMVSIGASDEVVIGSIGGFSSASEIFLGPIDGTVPVFIEGAVVTVPNIPSTSGTGKPVCANTATRALYVATGSSC